jgi:hypothetical protein
LFLTVIAEQTDAVPFQNAPRTGRARIGVYPDPKKGHIAEIFTNNIFDGLLLLPHISRGAPTNAPICRGLIGERARRPDSYYRIPD